MMKGWQQAGLWVVLFLLGGAATAGWGQEALLGLLLVAILLGWWQGWQLAREAAQQESSNRAIIHRLLETALQTMPVHQQLDTLLDILFTTSQFDFIRKGGFYLLAEENDTLLLVAQRGFEAEMVHRCSAIKSGHCLCGRAWQKKESLYLARVEDLQSAGGDLSRQYGIYCQPLHKEGTIFGLLTLYVTAGHAFTTQQEEFLRTLTMTAVSLMEKARLEEKIRQQAQYDPLTGLPNRALFLDRLSQSLAHAHRNNGEVVVVILDVDHFKQINDSMGHTVGDALLKEVAKRLLTVVRNTDTVARLGGDEFTIILPKLTHLFYVEYVARRLLDGLRQPMELSGVCFTITASMGVTVFPHDGRDVEALLKNADNAMYTAKDQGRDGFRFFSEEMGSKALERLALEQAVKRGLEQGEFIAYYQPKVHADGHVVGMEALVRWQRPEVGLCYPGDFIPFAEQSGLIVPLGERMLELACQQTRIWQLAGLGDLAVSVNLSARQLRLGDKLIEQVERILQQSGLPPQFLELEVTESMMMENLAEVRQLLERIRDLGVKLSIDDFGTGYSSLSVLRHLPIQTIKIDRSFVRGVDMDGDSRILVSAIIAMARQLGLSVVAEGVESQEEKDIVVAEGCQVIQGYYYSKPVSPERFAEYVHKQNGS
ncbi:MAG: EAL domain-containing protein [Magnetococcales bacterium]|nr:EAL domain-containing protein [Magnetococcales bacterium]